MKTLSKKKKIFDIIQIGDKSNLASCIFDIFIVINIFANIIVMILQTYDEFQAGYFAFRIIEFVTTVVFLIEYILRIWTADYLYPNLSKGKARVRFLLSFDGIVDLFTIIPVFFLTGFIAFRMLRVVRIFHLFRLNAKYDSFNVITSVLLEKKNQILSSIFIILILMLSSSLCMYSAEHDAQPEVFRNAFSGLWWAVNTILTIGYGDITPITVIGKIMAILIAFLGVGAVAIPTGIISAGFVERYTKDQNITDYRNYDLEDIMEIKVSNTLTGRSINDIHKTDNLEIYLVMRDDLKLIPSDNLVLKKDDIIIAKKK